MWNCEKMKKMVNYGFLRKHSHFEAAQLCYFGIDYNAVFFLIKFWKIIFLSEFMPFISSLRYSGPRTANTNHSI